LRTCTIITTTANAVVAPVHQRMPVILERDQAWEWVAGRDGVDLQRMLVPFNPELMTAYQVRPYVSNPAYESRVCMEPIQSLF
jgi:putative SOS response-associated peptidase YedK